MGNGLRSATALVVGLVLCGSASAGPLQFVTVGNPNNAADPATGLGAVAYGYQIGKYEVTNDQYAEFLNAKAASATFSLYNTEMDANAQTGGIVRAGSDGSYTYSVKPGRGNQPVTHVSWYDAIRFANWQYNGKGNGDTETGSYTLLGGTTVPSNANSITRNAGATFVLASEQEWYKAAFYDPTKNGSGGYWLYPTRSDADPNSDQPPGDPAIQTNVVNFFRDDGDPNGYNDGYAVTGSTSISTLQNYLTDVGAYTSAASYYGTFDQAGNIMEWNERLFSGVNRGVRGSAWIGGQVFALSSGAQGGIFPTNENGNTGFRIAVVPEPASTSLMLAAGAMALARRRRHRP